jgi:hypothetical protein
MPTPVTVLVMVRVVVRVVVLRFRWLRWWVIRGVVPVVIVGSRRVPVVVRWRLRGRVRR